MPGEIIDALAIGLTVGMELFGNFSDERIVIIFQDISSSYKLQFNGHYH